MVMGIKRFTEVALKFGFIFFSSSEMFMWSTLYWRKCPNLSENLKLSSFSFMKIWSLFNWQFFQ